MSIVKPFQGLRPRRELAAKVAAPPYDVLDSDEAREMAKGNPLTFLHVNKPEIDLDPAIDVYDTRVYEKGAENLRKFIADGTLLQDPEERYYIYRQIMGEHAQTGLVSIASVDEYEQDLIKKHEFTRPVKEDDRVNHMKYLNAQVGPVFLTYKARPEIDALIEQYCQKTPEYDFVSPDQVRHTLWLVEDPASITKIGELFAAVDVLYVADGHHRSAAAQRVRDLKRRENPAHSGRESYNYFLVVIFPHDQMQILDYNRVVKDLHGLSPEALLDKIREKFDVAETEAVKPDRKRCFLMYLQGIWYRLTAKPGTYDSADPVKSLDVSILQDNLLTPLLGIRDPRKDKRIDFVGGIRGLKELEKRVNSGQWEVAFALHPTSIEELMSIADAGKVMPPKSTWFEPKLRSGLVVHLLD
ncbi:MAG: DUF1015 domain-containing protein [bacterium]|nr:MAG: DUF1015 domain-containing protein [bacterium]